MGPVDRDEYPFPEKFHTRNGLKLHYVDEGSGDPLIMVHGNPTWSLYFRNLVKAFRGTHRTIAVDHIGCGRSDKPNDAQYDFRLKSRIDDLESLVSHLGVKRNLTLIVHDWGGAIGMGFAARHPEMISRLVILNTFAFRLPTAKMFPVPLWLCKYSGLGAFLVLYLNAFAGIASVVAPKKGLSKRLRRSYLAPYDSPATRLATLRFVQDIPLAPADPSYGQLVEIEQALPKFAQTPMLICWGEQDFVFDRPFLDEWRRRFPQAEVHSFPDYGHYILEDGRREIIPLISDFFARHPVK